MLDVRGLLTRDAICRKLRQWPLLEPSQMEQTFGDTGETRWTNDENMEAIHELQHRYFCASSQYAHRGVSGWEDVEQEAINLLAHEFSFSLDLLKHFGGRIVAAGGAIFKAVHGMHDIDDMDFFFVDPDVEKLDPAMASQKYDRWLAEAIAFLADKWLYSPHPVNRRKVYDAVDGQRVDNVYVLRSEFVTTVHLVSSQFDAIKYQFIHRVYPSVGAILGGFDLGPCMVATNGRRILATELGAWSCFGRTLIVDTSRRSTSFEHRIKKYSKYCHVLLPGLPRNFAIQQGADMRGHQDVTLSRLEKFVESSGFGSTCPQLKTHKSYRSQLDEIARSSRFVCVEPSISVDEMLEVLRRKAAKMGFILRNTNQIDVVRMKQTPGDVEELHEGLMRIAHSAGYHVDFGSLAAYMFIPEDDENVREIVTDRRPVLREKRYICELPFARLNLETFVPSYVSAPYVHLWRFSGLKSGQSDYGDSKIWPSSCIESNLTLLAKNNLSAVVAPLVLVEPGKAIVTPYGPSDDGDRGEINMRSLVGLESCARRVTSGVIEDVIFASLKYPTFGDYDESIKARLSGGSRFFGLDVDCYSDEIAKKTIYERLDQVRTKLTGVNWIVRNPGRQWTSSINPIMSDPREWYGEHYQSFRLGCEEVETCLRLMRLRDNYWKKLPKDIFSRIVRQMVWDNSLIMENHK